MNKARSCNNVLACGGRRVIHVWDRGFASWPWLQEVLAHPVRFILRWPALQAAQRPGSEGQRLAGHAGKRSVDSRNIWDARRHCWRKTGLVFAPYDTRLMSLPYGLLLLVLVRGVSPGTC